MNYLNVCTKKYAYNVANILSRSYKNILSKSASERWSLFYFKHVYFNNVVNEQFRYMNGQTQRGKFGLFWLWFDIVINTIL